MKAREYTNIQNYIDSKENRLLNKTDLLKMVEPQHLQDFKKWKVKDLRAHFGITHKINGKYKNLIIMGKLNGMNVLRFVLINMFYIYYCYILNI